MTIVFNIPTWGVWIVAAMLAASIGVNIWHGIVVRDYMRWLNRPR
jgi:hypothetical protein